MGYTSGLDQLSAFTIGASMVTIIAVTHSDIFDRSVFGTEVTLSRYIGGTDITCRISRAIGRTLSQFLRHLHYESLGAHSFSTEHLDAIKMSR